MVWPDLDGTEDGTEEGKTRPGVVENPCRGAVRRRRRGGKDEGVGGVGGYCCIDVDVDVSLVADRQSGGVHRSAAAHD